MTLNEIEAWAGQPLPSPYRDFLIAQEESVAVGDLVLLYGRQDFVERNETFQTKEYCPSFVSIGNDSGGRQFILSLTKGRISVVDTGAMMPEYFHPIADDFAEWRSGGCRFDGDDDD